MRETFVAIDTLLTKNMQKYGISILRISLSIVFIWFGVLKIIDATPVADLIQSTYPFLPEPLFIRFLGVWEVIIGVGLLFKLFLRITLLLLWIQMGGIFFGFFVSPSLYLVDGNFFLLNVYGEFVIKNIVLIAASLVVGGKELRKLR